MSDPEKILVIKLGALGDFIQALGPMAAIRKHHPNANITLLTTSPFQQFAQDCGYFNHVHLDEKPHWTNITGWLRLRAFLNESEFKRVYDLQNNDRTAFYLKLFSKHKRPEWVGAAPGASHRNNSPARTAGHAFDGHVQTLMLAGIHNIKIDTLEWMQANISSFPLRKPYILMVPGSSPEHPEKRWPADKYGRLAKILGDTGYQIVVLGTSAEQDVAAEICKIYPTTLDLTGQTTLAQIGVMARSAAAAIGNDTGPMHLIAATGCPCVSLFSPHSDPLRHKARGHNVQVLQSKDLQSLKAEKVLKLIKPREQPSSVSATKH